VSASADIGRLKGTLTGGFELATIFGDTPAMPLPDAHFGGFFALSVHSVEPCAPFIKSGVQVLLPPTIPAKAMLSGVPSNRRVTCF